MTGLKLGCGWSLQRVMFMLCLVCPLCSVDGLVMASLASLQSARLGSVFPSATRVRSLAFYAGLEKDRSDISTISEHDDKAIYRALHQVGGGMFYRGVRGRRYDARPHGALCLLCSCCGAHLSHAIAHNTAVGVEETFQPALPRR